MIYNKKVSSIIVTTENTEDTEYLNHNVLYIYFEHENFENSEKTLFAKTFVHFVAFFFESIRKYVSCIKISVSSVSFVVI